MIEPEVVVSIESRRDGRFGVIARDVLPDGKGLSVIKQQLSQFDTMQQAARFVIVIAHPAEALALGLIK